MSIKLSKFNRPKANENLASEAGQNSAQPFLSLRAWFTMIWCRLPRVGAESIAWLCFALLMLIFGLYLSHLT